MTSSPSLGARSSAWRYQRSGEIADVLAKENDEPKRIGRDTWMRASGDRFAEPVPPAASSDMPLIDRERWRDLEPLLDHALTLSGDDRAAWLEDLRGQSPAIAAELTALLAEEDRADRRGFLLAVVTMRYQHAVRTMIVAAPSHDRAHAARRRSHRWPQRGPTVAQLLLRPDLMRLFLVRPKLFTLIAATLSIESAISQGTARQDGVAITFLANEGVMLSSGTKSVLIDGLFLKYETGYAVPADSTRAALERAGPPFDSVNLILVTHHHGDHFHPAPVAAHLRANPRATLLTSRQVIDSLRGRVSARELLAPRFMARTTAPRTRRHEVVNGIAVELLGLPHGGGWRSRGIQHLGYVVELGGRRVLHVGDTDFSEATFAPFRLDTARIDVALIPYGAVVSRKDRAVIERWIRPKHVVAFHVGEGEGARVARAVQAALPGAVTLRRSLETHRW